MRLRKKHSRGVFAHAALVACLLFTAGQGCASRMHRRGVARVDVNRAEMLIRQGLIDSARVELTRLRDSLAGTAEGARAQYALAYLNVFSGNRAPDWATALVEFRRYMTDYPEHEHVEEAHAWVRLLSQVERLRASEQMRSEQTEELLRNDMLLKQMGGRAGLSTILDTMHRCLAEKDSLAAKIRLMEEVIRAIERRP